jgi:hypothetical protein
MRPNVNEVAGKRRCGGISSLWRRSDGEREEVREAAYPKMKGVRRCLTGGGGK